MNFKFKKYIFVFFLLFVNNLYSAISFGKKNQLPYTTYSIFEYIKSLKTKKKIIFLDKKNNIIPQEDIILYLKNFQTYLHSIGIDHKNIPKNFFNAINERQFLDYYATQLVLIREEVSYCSSEVAYEYKDIPLEKNLKHFQYIPLMNIKQSKFLF